MTTASGADMPDRPPERRRTQPPERGDFDEFDADGGVDSDELGTDGLRHDTDVRRRTVHSSRTPRPVDEERPAFDVDTEELVRRQEEEIVLAERGDGDRSLIRLLITSSHRERREQTKAITRSLAELRGTMVKGLIMAAASNLVAMLLLGSIAGAVVWFKGTATGGGSLEFTTNAPTHVPMSVPVKVRVSDTDGMQPTED